MIARIVNLATLGAVTTVAVAWIGPCFPGQSPTVITQNYPYFDGQRYMVAVSRLSPYTAQVYWRSVPKGQRIRLVEVGDRDREPPEWSGVWSAERRRASAASGSPPGEAHGRDVATGWPLLSMVGATSPQSQASGAWWRRNGTILYGPDRTWSIAPGRVQGQSRQFPLVPMWPGFAADTAIYGLVWFVALLVLGAWIRHRRRRAGLCVGCRYDLCDTAPDAPCPECGRQR